MTFLTLTEHTATGTHGKRKPGRYRLDWSLVATFHHPAKTSYVEQCGTRYRVRIMTWMTDTEEVLRFRAGVGTAARDQAFAEAKKSS